MDTMQCAFCLSDRNGEYYKNMYVTLVSIFNNTERPLTAHIIHDGTVTEKAQTEIRRLCESHNGTVYFHVFTNFGEDVKEIAERWYPSSFYRFYMQDMIDADKLVYLDADIIVNRDLYDLYSIDISDKMIAAVPDCQSYWNEKGQVRGKYAKKIAYLKPSKELFFNGGVMLLNLGEIRRFNKERNIFMDTLLDAVHAGLNIDYPVQDTLNSIMAKHPEKLLLLDNSFNFLISQANTMNQGLPELDNKIVHMLHKPDQWVCPAQMLFWKYYSQTIFAGDMFERIDQAYRRKNMRFLIDYCKYPKHRQHVVDILENGFFGFFVKTFRRRLLGRS